MAFVSGLLLSSAVPSCRQPHPHALSTVHRIYASHLVLPAKLASHVIDDADERQDNAGEAALPARCQGPTCCGLGGRSLLGHCSNLGQPLEQVQDLAGCPDLPVCAPLSTRDALSALQEVSAKLKLSARLCDARWDDRAVARIVQACTRGRLDWHHTPHRKQQAEGSQPPVCSSAATR